MARVTLYTRKRCCLCDDAKAILMAARSRAAFEYEEIDIDAEPALVAAYNDQIPVITVDGVKAFKYKVDMHEFLKKLAARA